LVVHELKTGTPASRHFSHRPNTPPADVPFLVGCDFSSRPSRKKPIVLALGQQRGGRVQLTKLERLLSLDEFVQWLRQSQPWVGAFDLPFGLPRELIEHLNWPRQWADCMRHYAALSRAEIRDTFASFCNVRPVGSKFAHRATDRPAGSSPSMKWVNPPVAYMLHAGVPLLMAAGVSLVGLHPGELGDENGGGGQSGRPGRLPWPVGA
jgi:hypothetical protein